MDNSGYIDAEEMVTLLGKLGVPPDQVVISRGAVMTSRGVLMTSLCVLMTSRGAVMTSRGFMSISIILSCAN